MAATTPGCGSAPATTSRHRFLSWLGFRRRVLSEGGAEEAATGPLRRGVVVVVAVPCKKKRRMKTPLHITRQAIPAAFAITSPRVPNLERGEYNLRIDPRVRLEDAIYYNAWGNSGRQENDI